MKCNKLLSLFIALCMICGLTCIFPAAAQAVSENLLANGGFENETGSNETVWGFYNDGAKIGVSTSAEEKHSGSYSLKMNGCTEADAWSEAKQMVTPTESGTYVVSGWVKTNATNASESWRSRIMIKEPSASDDDAVAMMGLSELGADFPTTDWKEFSFEIELQVNTEYGFYLKANAGGTENTTFLDDLSLKKKAADQPPQPSANLLANGGFENETGANETVWGFYNDGAKIGVSTSAEEKHSGSHSLKMNGCTEADAWSDAKQMVTPTESGTYVVSGWVKTNATNAGESWRSRIMIKEPSVSDDDAVALKDIIQMGLTIPLDGWTQFSFEIELQANTEYGFYLKANAGGVENTYYLDDLSLTKKVAEQPPQPAGELLVNGGFESGEAGWTISSPGAAVSTEQAKSGSNSFRLNGVGATDAGNWAEAKQSITPEETGTYVVTGWLKTTSTDANNSWRSRIMIKEPSASDDDAVAMMGLSELGADFPTLNWKEFSFEIELTGGKEYVFFLKGNDGGEANTTYLDDLSLTKKKADQPTPPEGELLINGGFESGEAGWTISSPGAAVSTEQAKSGSNSFRLNGVGATDAGNWAEAKQSITPEETGTYVVTGWLKTTSTDANNSWRSRIMIKEPSASDDDAVAMMGLSELGADFPTTDWKEFSFEIELTSGKEYVFFLKGNDGGTENTTYLDDLSLTKKAAEQPPQPAGDLLVNGGFENGSAGWESNYWSSGVASIVEDGTSPEGQKHLKLSSANDDWYNVTQAITVEANETYDVSFKAKVTSAAERWDVFIKLAWNDGSAWVDLQEAFNPSNTQSGWQDCSFSFLSGEHTQLTLFLGGHASTWEIDALRITKREQPPEPPQSDYDLYVPMPKTLLSNGSFEEGQSDWKSNNWDAGIARIAEGSADDPSPDGKKHLYFSDDVDGTWFSVSQAIAVEKNTTYEVTFRCRVTSSSTTWGVYSKLAKSNGDDLQAAYNPDINKTGWQACSYTFQSGDETMLTFYLGGNVSTFEADDIQIKAISELITSINESRGAIRADRAYTLTGNTSKPSAVTVTVNGAALPNAATIGADNAFRIPLTLLGGRNTVTVTAAAGSEKGKTVAFDLYGQKIAVSNVQTSGNFAPSSVFGCTFDAENLTTDSRRVTAVLTVHDANNTLKYITYAQQDIGGRATESLSISADDFSLTDITGCSVQIRLIDEWGTLIPYPQKEAIWPAG